MSLVNKKRESFGIKKLIFITSLVLGLSVLYLANPLLGDNSPILTTALYVSSTGFLCFITTRVLINSRKYDPKIFVPVLMFTISVFFIFAAEQTWIFYVEVLDEDPFPSIADVFYLATYPFMGLYLVSRFKSFGLQISKKVILFGIVMSTALLVPTMLAAYDWNYEEDSTPFLIAMSYPVLDGVLFGITMIGLLFIYSNKQLNYFWGLIFAGILILVVADTAWLFMEIEGAYYDGQPVDVLWLSSYIIFGYAFTLKNKKITDKFYHSKQNESDAPIINLAAITKMGIPLSLATIISLVTFFMYDLGMFGFFGSDDSHGVCQICYLVIGMMVAFSAIIIILMKNTRGLVKVREFELKIKQNKEIKKERLTTVGVLGARLAHDMKNPLSVIKNNVELLSELSKDIEFQKRPEFDRTFRAISRMNHQVDNVLNYVRDRELELSSINISKLVLSTIDDLQPIKVKVKMSSQDIVLNSDPHLLMVLLTNLIINAKQAIDESGEIIVTLSEINNKVILEVQDSGPGIPEENVTKIFDPLFTTKQEGTGLGLASCKSIVQELGGIIYVKNKPTTFTIAFPNNV